MRLRPQSVIVPIVVIMMVSSAVRPEWWTSALSPLIRTRATVPAVGAVTFAADDNADNVSGSSDNADNSGGGDNADNSSSGSDNADNSGGSDNADNSSGGDNADNSSGDGDNADNSGGSDDADNSSGGGDNTDGGDNSASEDGGDNVSASDGLTSPALAASPTVRSSPTVSPDQASGTSSGTDADVVLPNGHVTVHLFAAMPSGIDLTVSPVDLTTVPTPPGTPVHGLGFSLAAHDRTNDALTTLPSAVYLHTQYTDADLAGAADQDVTLYWLDPTDNQWKSVSGVVPDPVDNVVEASTMNLGDYVVAVP